MNIFQWCPFWGKKLFSNPKKFGFDIFILDIEKYFETKGKSTLKQKEKVLWNKRKKYFETKMTWSKPKPKKALYKTKKAFISNNLSSISNILRKKVLFDLYLILFDHVKNMNGHPNEHISMMSIIKQKTILKTKKV